MGRKEKIRKILDRKDLKDLSAEEVQELHLWLNVEDAEADLKAIFYTKWLEASASGKINSEKIFNSISSRSGISKEKLNSDELILKEISRPPVTLRNRALSFLRYAAVFIIAALSTVYFTDRREKEILLVNQDLNSVSAPYGSKTYLELSDGTRVWLNSGSKLSYPGYFDNESRVVKMEGEAFFDVAKDPNRPFTVNTSDIDVIVLGTQFNLKSYPDEKNIETTVIEGSVKLVPNKVSRDLSKEVVLKPNEKATYDRGNSRIKIDNIAEVVDVKTPVSKSTAKETVVKKEEVITAWKNEHLVFQRESLRDMAKKLERWYGMTIIIDERISSDDTYSGKFMNNETIYQVLEAINIITPIQTEVKETTIYIRPKKK